MWHVQNNVDATMLWRPCGYLAAATVAWLVIGPALNAAQTTPPNVFGWERLVIVHVLLALPVCAVIASGTRRLEVHATSRRVVASLLRRGCLSGDSRRGDAAGAYGPARRQWSGLLATCVCAERNCVGLRASVVLGRRGTVGHSTVFSTYCFLANAQGFSAPHWPALRSSSYR